MKLAALLPRRTWTRRVLVLVGTFVVLSTLVESVTRVVFASTEGPEILLYGFRDDRQFLSRHADNAVLRVERQRWDRAVANDDKTKDFRGGYSKYFPHQEKRGRHVAGGASFPIRINNLGFRGEDVSVDESPGVTRVVTLGGSSTFGFSNADDETYPFYLELELERLARHAGRDMEFEVLNLGVPHLTSFEIRELFLAEALPLQPDVVTFYEGANDTRLIRRSRAENALLSLASYSLFALYAAHQLSEELETFGPDDVRALGHGRREAFLTNVAAIEEECRSRGIRFLIVTQQVRSGLLSPEDLREVPYPEEVEHLRAALDRGERLRLDGVKLLLHADLMEALRSWAAENDVPLVDAAAAMDRAGVRDSLVSWVHLSADGNRFLAGELAPPILRATVGGAE